MNNLVTISNFRSLFTTATLVVLATGKLTAQVDSSPLREPILPRMPARSAWTLTYSQKTAPPQSTDEAGGKVNVPSSMTATIQKDGTIYHVHYAQAVAGYTDIWSINGITLAVNSAATGVAIVSSVLFPLTDFSTGDFEDFTWVQKPYFKGKQKLGDREVLVFEADSLKRQLTARERSIISQMQNDNHTDQQGAILDDPESAKKPPREIKPLQRDEILKTLGWDRSTLAYLDPATQQPVLLTSGDFKVSIGYLPAGQALTPPKIVIDRMVLERDKMRSFQKKSSQPRP